MQFEKMLDAQYEDEKGDEIYYINDVDIYLRLSSIKCTFKMRL
jgi:hypothetical protein